MKSQVLPWAMGICSSSSQQKLIQQTAARQDLYFLMTENKNEEFFICRLRNMTKAKSMTFYRTIFLVLFLVFVVSLETAAKHVNSPTELTCLAAVSRER